MTPDGSVRIGELAEQVGLSVNWLRHLADTGVIPSSRSAGGHRRFDVEAVRVALARREKRATAGADQTAVAAARSPLASAESRTEAVPLGPVPVAPLQPPSWHDRVDLAGLEEHAVWMCIVSDLGLDRTTDAGRIMGYAFTEMLNNAIDHSSGGIAEVSFWVLDASFAFRVRDDGTGVFRRLREGLGLDSDIAAVQELTKGKRTTMAERHSGEGIFFTSKVVDLFQLSSARLRWTVDNVRLDQALGRADLEPGTTVLAQVGQATTRRLRDVFAQFTENHEFVRTRPVVKLFSMNMPFVSRSEARRVLAGLGDFTEVEVDFAGVDDVGQGFVDELLRVWPKFNPGKRVIPINMNEVVAFMVQRGLPTSVAPVTP